MSFTLPAPIGGAAGWSLSDFTELTLQTKGANGTGVATVYGPQLDNTTMWLIDHAVTSCTSIAPSSVRFYNGQLGPGFLIDGTDAGNFDVADWPNGLQIRPGGMLIAQWSEADPGAVGTLTLQARVMRSGA